MRDVLNLLSVTHQLFTIKGTVIFFCSLIPLTFVFLFTSVKHV